MDQQFGVVNQDGADGSPPRGLSIVAWLVIIAVCVVIMFANAIGSSPPDSETESGQRFSKDDEMTIILTEMQARYMVGAAELTSNSESMYSMSKSAFEQGTVGQRQRFVILAADLAGAEAGYDLLSELIESIETEIEASAESDQPFALTDEQTAIQSILHELYAPPAGDEAERDEWAIDQESITNEERKFLTENYGWFGELALHPLGTDGRADVIHSAKRVAIILIAAVIGAGLAAFCGFAGLIVMFVMMVRRKIRLRIHPGVPHHGVYAETFALWMVVFFGLQISGEIASKAAPDLTMVFFVSAFLCSMSALFWPVIRGVPWSVARQDIGWTGETKPLLEPVTGVAGYAMALPILAVGVGITFLLTLVQQSSAAQGPAFEPMSDPSHPVVLHLASGEMFSIVQILFLGAVVAPIVEETMFRGVLYRHLREATTSCGVAVSIVLSALINSFIFAAIHPQGWVAIPALMSLAIAFSLIREWRGTVIPSMIVHGLSNFIVLSLLALVLSS